MLMQRFPSGSFFFFLHNIEGDPFTFLISELTGVSEEAPPVAPPVAPAVSEPQAAAPSLSQSQPCRTEESERPVEQQPPLELPPEPCKVPLHVPISNSMRESLPMNHISTTLTGWIWFLSFTVNKQDLLAFCFNVLISTFASHSWLQKSLLLRPLSSCRSRSPWRFLWQ